MSEAITNPAFRAMIAEMRGINSRVDALINLMGPKPFILDLFNLDKAAVFADTRVECIGADLIQISSDGDLTDVSYKIVHLDGSVSLEMEAVESPHILGPVNAVLVSNDTAEAGMTVKVARNQGAIAALAAIQHGTPSSTVSAAAGRMFYAEIVEYVVGADNFFEDDEPIGAVAPTHNFVGVPLVTHIMIHGVKYQMIPTAAVTYQLYLLEGATAEAQQQEAEIIYDSGPGIVGGDIVNWVAGGAPSRLPVMARLTAAGTIWYKLDWSAAPGNTAGYIRVYGEALA